MAIVSKATLKTYFQDGKEPDEHKYIDLIDTMAEIGGVAGDFVIGGDVNVYNGLFVGNVFSTTQRGYIHALNRLICGSGWGYRVLELNGGAGYVRGIVCQSNGKPRWLIQTSPEAESGSNAGSNFQMHRYEDDGSWISNVIKINRDDGLIQLLEDVYIEDDIYTAPWAQYTGTTIVGFSSITVNVVLYKKVGNTVFVQFAIQGNSSLSTVSFTLPFDVDVLGTGQIFQCLVYGINAGNPQTQPARLDIPVSGRIFNVYKDLAAGAWAANGIKGVRGEFFYHSA